VGFPGETEDDFLQTVRLAQEVGFAKMHVFKFSPRLGTAAASMQGSVNNGVMNERSIMMRKLDTELGTQFRRQFLREKVEVLVENTEGTPSGRCERYFMVHLNDTPNECKKNTLVQAVLTDVNPTGAVGRALKTRLSATESP
jgi:threonylcarbamoyladenosine tRNA methylthiotransferase MtaB